MTETLVARLEPLQRSPWAGWRTKTRVTVRFLDDQGQAEQTHVQPDLLYVVEARDQRLARFQEVHGQVIRQELPISLHQGGLPAEPEHPAARPTEITIDGVAIPARVAEQSLEWIGPDSGGTATTRTWVARDRPGLLLRREQGEDWWAVTSLKAERRIGDQPYRCVELSNRLGMVDGYVLTTQVLCAGVPGHRVEKIDRFFKPGARPDSKPWLITHERVIDIQIPSDPGE